nr:CoA transferase [Lentzea indica]
MTSAPSGTFRTADGELNIAANKQEQFVALCRALGRLDLITDLRFVTREDRKANREALQSELEASLRKGSALEWEELLASAGVPAARVLTVPQALGLVPELIHSLPFPGAPERTIHVLGNGIRVNGRAAAPCSPPPLLGEHNDDILEERR